jgi:hypothetical protein
VVLPEITGLAIARGVVAQLNQRLEENEAGYAVEQYGPGRNSQALEQGAACSQQEGKAEEGQCPLLHLAAEVDELAGTASFAFWSYHSNSPLGLRRPVTWST